MVKIWANIGSNKWAISICEVLMVDFPRHVFTKDEICWRSGQYPFEDRNPEDWQYELNTGSNLE